MGIISKQFMPDWWMWNLDVTTQVHLDWSMLSAISEVISEGVEVFSGWLGIERIPICPSVAVSTMNSCPGTNLQPKRQHVEYFVVMEKDLSMVSQCIYRQYCVVSIIPWQSNHWAPMIPYNRPHIQFSCREHRVP